MAKTTAITSKRAELRSIILGMPIDGSIALKQPVYVADSEYPSKKWHLPIIRAERWGAKGVAYVTDGINGWRLNELTEKECAEIIKALDIDM